MLMLKYRFLCVSLGWSGGEVWGGGRFFVLDLGVFIDRIYFFLVRGLFEGLFSFGEFEDIFAVLYWGKVVCV